MSLSARLSILARRRAVLSAGPAPPRTLAPPAEEAAPHIDPFEFESMQTLQAPLRVRKRVRETGSKKRVPSASGSSKVSGKGAKAAGKGAKSAGKSTGKSGGIGGKGAGKGIVKKTRAPGRPKGSKNK